MELGPGRRPVAEPGHDRAVDRIDRRQRRQHPLARGPGEASQVQDAAGETDQAVLVLGGGVGGLRQPFQTRLHDGERRRDGPRPGLLPRARFGGGGRGPDHPADLGVLALERAQLGRERVGLPVDRHDLRPLQGGLGLEVPDRRVGRVQLPGVEPERPYDQRDCCQRPARGRPPAEVDPVHVVAVGWDDLEQEAVARHVAAAFAFRIAARSSRDASWAAWNFSTALPYVRVSSRE